MRKRLARMSVGGVRRGHLAEVLTRDRAGGQVAPRAVVDGQVLHRAGVAILQPAVGQAAEVDLPAAADGGQGVGRGPAGLLQAVEGERAAVAGGDVGQLLDLEVIGVSLSFMRAL